MKYRCTFKSELIQTHTDFTDSYRLTLYYYNYFNQLLLYYMKQHVKNGVNDENDKNKFTNGANTLLY